MPAGRPSDRQWRMACQTGATHPQSAGLCLLSSAPPVDSHPCCGLACPASWHCPVQHQHDQVRELTRWGCTLEMHFVVRVQCFKNTIAAASPALLHGIVHRINMRRALSQKHCKDPVACCLGPCMAAAVSRQQPVHPFSRACPISWQSACLSTTNCQGAAVQSPGSQVQSHTQRAKASSA